MTDLQFTGERVVPGDMREYMGVLSEHLTRYVFAAAFLRGGERVLDAACGTGYGSFLLALGAESVIGLDIAPEAVKFASARFSWPGLQYEVADLDNVTLPPAFDMVVSFETLEHLQDPGAFIGQVARSLAQEGVFICSLPRNQPSEFHRHVYEWEGAKALVEPWFEQVQWFGQRDRDTALGTLYGSSLNDEGIADANYFIAACRVPLPRPDNRG